MRLSCEETRKNSNIEVILNAGAQQEQRIYRQLISIN